MVDEYLVLAVIDRAERHRARPTPEVPIWAIKEHLDLPRYSRRVRAPLDALEAAGHLERSRRHGVERWMLTATGCRRLQRARRAGKVPALPESPQHRTWREARAAAAQEIDPFRHKLRAAIHEATRLLEAEPPAHSDAWFALAEQLRRSAWQVGSATHCLYEWAEPDDERADIDDRHEPSDDELSDDERADRRSRRNGRRSTSMWVLTTKQTPAPITLSELVTRAAEPQDRDA